MSSQYTNFGRLFFSCDFDFHYPCLSVDSDYSPPSYGMVVRGRSIQLKLGKRYVLVIESFSIFFLRVLKILLVKKIAFFITSYQGTPSIKVTFSVLRDERQSPAQLVGPWVENPVNLFVLLCPLNVDHRGSTGIHSARTLIYRKFEFYPCCVLQERIIRLNPQRRFYNFRYPFRVITPRV